MEHIRPNIERAKIAIMLLWVVMIFEVISFISDFFQYELLSRMANGTAFTMEEATSNDNRQLMIAVFFVIAMIISMITFIRWFRRAYFNLHVRVRQLEHTVDAALWCWFIPIMNLFKPFAIMKEMYERTDQLFYEKKPGERSPLNHSLLAFWWTFWVISRIVGQIATRYSLRAEGSEEIINSTLFTMASSVIGIIGGLLAIGLVTNYSKMESMLDEMESETEPSEIEILTDPADPALS